MDIQPKNQQPISDDEELAKVLAGISQENDGAAAPAPTAPAVEEPVAPVDEPVAPVEEPTPVAEPATEPEPVEEPAYEEPSGLSMSATPAVASTGDSMLDSIKQEALGELRPLVDKLNVSPEEKFDAYLLLLRTTDDKALIAPAHAEAKNITDEARRAQALLDIIKEIDFLAGDKQS